MPGFSSHPLSIFLSVWCLTLSCPVGSGKTIAELSFKADDWKAAAGTRSRLQAFLDEQGILIHGDSLKTQAILNAVP